MKKTIMKKYANLLIKQGVNIKKGQELVIVADVEAAPFVALLTAEAYRDELAAVYEALIAQGRGIEINVSGLRTGHTSYPNASALALYHDLGGEILTLGSDAHTPEDASVGIREGAELLRTIGFRYYTVFEQRKPTFLSLE